MCFPCLFSRSYNYSTVHTSSPSRHGDRSRDLGDRSHDISDPSQEPPYEYVAIHHANSHAKDLRHRSDSHLDRPRPDPDLDRLRPDLDLCGSQYRGDYSSGKAFSNQVYMDHRELDRVQSTRDVYRSANGGGEPDTFPPPPPLEHSYARPR